MTSLKQLRLRNWWRGLIFDIRWHRHKKYTQDTCMCGEDIWIHHPFWSNHAPVSKWDYYRMSYVTDGSKPPIPKGLPL